MSKIDYENRNKWHGKPFQDTHRKKTLYFSHYSVADDQINFFLDGYFGVSIDREEFLERLENGSIKEGIFNDQLTLF